MNLSTVLWMSAGRESAISSFLLQIMFNLSANHLFLLSRKEYRSCAVFLMLDRDTQRVYRMHDFSKAHQLVPGQAYCVAGKVNSADTLYLVIESVRLDSKHARSSIVLAPADGAGGLPLD